MAKNVSTKAIPTLLKLLVFITPTIFVSNTHELFEFPKMYAVFALGTTILWLFLIKKIQQDLTLRWPSRLVLALVGVYFVSTLLSTHLYTSVWGYYTRFNGGLASLLIFIGLYWVLINEYSREQIKELSKIAALSLIPIGLYAITQHYEIVANVWKASATTRAFSTFGQPNWLAAYVVMLLPIILRQFLGFDEKDNNKFLWGLTYICGFSALWFSQSISGIFAFAISIPVFILLNLKEVKEKKGALSLILSFSLLFAIFNPGIFKEKLEDIKLDIQNMFVVQAQEEDVTEAVHNISDPGYIRQYLWQGTINLIQSDTKTMLIGRGPETFAYEFQNFRPEELNYSSEWNFVFNKPHNYYLELGANIGLIGLAVYLLLVSKTLKSRDKFFTPGLVAFFVTNMFGWPTVSTTLLFWIFLAGIESKK